MHFKICISITHSDLNRVREILNNFDFCELRLDLIRPELSELKQLLSIKKSVIITCREAEGIDRLKYLKEAVKHSPEYIDIEFETEESVKIELIGLCEVYGVKRIHSYHNFEETPELEFLEKIIEEENKNFKPSLIKIATYVNSERDNITLLSLLRQNIPLAVIGMGEMGKKTRVLAPLFGSKITFAGIDGNYSAPGQCDYFELKRIYNSLESLIK